MQNNFDANEILRQGSRVKEEVEKFYSDCNTMIRALETTSIAAKSEDSNLSQECRLFANSYIRLQAEIKNKFTKLADIMVKYAQESLKNQETLSNEFTNVGGSAEDIINMISSIGNDLPEIYVDWN